MGTHATRRTCVPRQAELIREHAYCACAPTGLPWSSPSAREPPPTQTSSPTSPQAGTDPAAKWRAPHPAPVSVVAAASCTAITTMLGLPRAGHLLHPIADNSMWPWWAQVLSRPCLRLTPAAFIGAEYLMIASRVSVFRARWPASRSCWLTPAAQWERSRL